MPWDKKQTLQTLRHLTIEETYELGDAILDNDQKKNWRLGILHFYAKIEAKQMILIADVCNEICEVNSPSPMAATVVRMDIKRTGKTKPKRKEVGAGCSKAYRSSKIKMGRV
jgi:hypothetical protein